MAKKKEQSNWDLAIMHIRHGTVVLTRKGKPGYIGTDEVLTFTDPLEIEDFINQLNAIADHCWPITQKSRGAR